MARRREQWRKYQGRLDPKRLVFVDETWASTNMTPIRGWSQRGKKLIGRVPHGRWRTMTFIAALRCDRIDAPYVLDGPINGLTFSAWVEQMLVPTLSPGDVVVMDNLASHKSKAVRQLIRAAGGKLLFLPPYSPDLNPIEQVFAKLKLLLRKAAERTVDPVWLSFSKPCLLCSARLKKAGLRQAQAKRVVRVKRQRWDLSSPDPSFRYSSALRTPRGSQGRRAGRQVFRPPRCGDPT